MPSFFALNKRVYNVSERSEWKIDFGTFFKRVSWGSSFTLPFWTCQIYKIKLRCLYFVTIF